MSKTIQGIPESITREQYTSLIESVGFSADRLMSLEFASDGIYAVAFEADADGNRVTDGTTDGFAKHRVFIPVVEVSA